MKVMMISTDANILIEGNVVRARMASFGAICDELHIIIPTSNFQLPTSKLQIAQNVFVYPENSSNKIFSLFKTYRLGIRILTTSYQLRDTNWVITTQDPFENGFIGWLIARKFKAKLLLQIHTDFLSLYFSNESALNKIRVKLAEFLLPKADSIRVVSERIRKSLVTCHLSLVSAPVVLPIFVDIEKIRKTEVKADLRKKYPQFDFLVLMASRLSREKNIDLAINAMGEIVKKHPRAGLIIVGSGSEEKNLKLKVESYITGYNVPTSLGRYANSTSPAVLARWNKLTANIIFEEWSEDVISYMKTADAFLNTSNYEGFGATLVEAAASDCPIVTTDVGIVSDILHPEEDVLVCPVGGAGCVLSYLERLISSPDLGKKLALKAQTSLERLVIDKEEYLHRMAESWEK